MAASLLKRSVHINDKVFLVTGGAAGVGAGVVRALLAENARHVAFIDIAEREGTALETELLTNFGPLRAKFIKCDVADEDQLAAAYFQVVDKYRRLDGVINSAAMLSDDDKHYKKMININFTATVSSTLKALEKMGADKEGNGGVIVNISSLLALDLTNNLPVYSATKAAVLQFSIVMGSQEYFSKTKVHVATVCLGPTDTAILNRRNLEKFDKDSSHYLRSRVPVRQRVESAVNGIIEVIKNVHNGAMWIVANDMPAYNSSENIIEAYQELSRGQIQNK